MKEKLQKFLFPTKIKIAVFLIFMLLVALATIQAWGFADQQGPKPFLYDAIRQIPFWAALAYLLAPIMIITVPLSQVGLGLLIFPIAIVYLYLFSCLIGLILERYLLQKR
ncbi:MAG: hypothetical protein HYW05_03325 [Candidatus Diapherotrites archaeon]|nr:hypothetical protein [Candidatus Diapherotrites archaeon]